MMTHKHVASFSKESQVSLQSEYDTVQVIADKDTLSSEKA